MNEEITFTDEEVEEQIEELEQFANAHFRKYEDMDEDELVKDDDFLSELGVYACSPNYTDEQKEKIYNYVQNKISDYYDMKYELEDVLSSHDYDKDSIRIEDDGNEIKILVIKY